MRDYRHKIDFLKRATGEDDYGEPTDTWTDFKTGIWASYDPLLGNELFTALTTDNKVEAKFNMRFVPDITSEMRIRHNDNVYEIIGQPVNVKGLNRELLCYCKLVR
jgi:SPP1 family predicted phage head-tail adaptor